MWENVRASREELLEVAGKWAPLAGGGGRNYHSDSISSFERKMAVKGALRMLRNTVFLRWDSFFPKLPTKRDRIWENVGLSQQGRGAALKQITQLLTWLNLSPHFPQVYEVCVSREQGID